MQAFTSIHWRDYDVLKDLVERIFRVSGCSFYRNELSIITHFGHIRLEWSAAVTTTHHSYPIEVDSFFFSFVTSE